MCYIRFFFQIIPHYYVDNCTNTLASMHEIQYTQADSLVALTRTPSLVRHMSEVKASIPTGLLTHKLRSIEATDVHVFMFKLWGDNDILTENI